MSNLIESSNEEMSRAFTELNIQELCIPDYFTTLALSKTNTTLNKVLHSQKRIIFGQISLPNSAYVSNSLTIFEDTMYGHICGVHFNGHAQLEVLCNDFNKEWFEYMYDFSIDIRCQPENQVIDDGDLIAKHLNALLSKGTKIRKLAIYFYRYSYTLKNCPDRNYGKIIRNICYGLKSHSIQTVFFSYRGVRTTTFIFSSLVNEMSIRQGLPRLQEVQIEMCFDQFMAGTKADYTNCFNLYNASTTDLLKLKILSESSLKFQSQPKFLRSSLQKEISNKIKFTCINYKTLMDLKLQPAIENCTIKYKDDFQTFCTNQLRLTEKISLAASSLSNKITTFKCSPKKTLFECLTAVELVLTEEVDFNQISPLFLRKAICTFPKTLKSLKMIYIDIDLSSFGEKLVAHYPDLVNLMINYRRGYPFAYQSYDINFFMPFQKLTILSLGCLKFKAFNYPTTLRILELKCLSQSKEPRMVPFCQKDEVNSYKSYVVRSNICDCFERKGGFNLSQINMTHNNDLFAYHYHKLTDLEQYFETFPEPYLSQLYSI